MIDPTNLFHFVLPPISQADPSSFRARAVWEVPRRLPWFEGHFPGHPVLPAVAILDATLELIHQAAPPPKPGRLVITGVRSAKFLRPVIPGLRIEIEIERIEPGEWRARWREAGPLPPEGGDRIGSSGLMAELAFQVDSR